MIKKNKNYSKLKATTTSQVRFSEVDSMQVVWHGNYVKYFEDGREAFGMQYDGLGYLDVYKNGFMTPIVDLQVQYKRFLKYGEVAVIETKYLETEAAKICFEYEIRRENDNELIAIGESTQVFVDLNGTLQLNAPDFYEEWKRKWEVK